MKHEITTTETFDLLQKKFESFDPPHRPNELHLEALENLIKRMSVIFHGDDCRRAYLSSLSPGIGKTTAIKAFLNHVAWNPDQETEDGQKFCEVGILICINTLDEIRSFCDGIDTSNVCVWVGREKEEDFADIGERFEPAEAQVLITTHARIEREIAAHRGRDGVADFRQAKTLFYKGQPRRLKLWDEAYLPGRPITVALKEIRRALPYVDEVFLELASDIDALVVEVSRTMELGDLQISKRSAKVECPDFMAKHGIGLDEIETHLKEERVRGKELEKLMACFEALEQLSGQTVIVRNDGNQIGDTLLSYQPTIPESFLPAVILDASGARKVRQTYHEMMIRGLVERIPPEATKSLRNLTVYWWNVGGGKSSFIKNFDNRVEGICRWIVSYVPEDERVLIIHHKPDEKHDSVRLYGRRKRRDPYAMPDLKESIEGYMAGSYPDFDCSRLEYTTWGMHRAQNKWRDIPNVVAAGTLFKPDSTYEANLRIARDTKATVGPARADELQEFKLGEYADDLIQGIGRGRIRQIDHEDHNACPPARALVIAAKRSGIPERLKEWFRDATVEPVQLTSGEVKGPAGEVIRYLEDWCLSAHYGHTIAFKRIQQELEINAKDFYDKVRRNTNVKAKLIELGLAEYVKDPAKSRQMEGWQRTPHPQASQDELLDERLRPGKLYGFCPVEDEVRI